MLWERPDFIEIRMDAEINGYQGDDSPSPVVPWWVLQPLDGTTGPVKGKQRPLGQNMSRTPCGYGS